MTSRSSTKSHAPSSDLMVAVYEPGLSISRKPFHETLKEYVLQRAACVVRRLVENSESMLTTTGDPCQSGLV